MSIDEKTASPDTNNDADFKEIARRLWAGKSWLIIFMFAGLLVGVIMNLISAPMYRADSLVQIEEQSGRLVLPTAINELTQDPARTITEIEIMGSRKVIGSAVADLHLDWVVSPVHAPVIGEILARYAVPAPELPFLSAYARKGERIELDLLQVPPDWVNRVIRLTVTGPGNFTAVLPNGIALDGKVGQSLIDPRMGFAIRVGEMPSSVGRQFTVLQIDEATAISRVRSALTIAERGRQSSVIELRLVAESPTRATRILNAIMDAYLQQNVMHSSAEAANSLEFVEKNLAQAEEVVAKAEAALNAVRTANQSLDLNFEVQNLLTQVTTLERQLRELDGLEDDLKKRYTPNHPAYQQLLAERARVTADLDRLRGEVARLPDMQRDIVNLTRDLDLAQTVYRELLSRAQELRVMRASTIGNVRIIDTAYAPPVPISPRRSRNLVISLLLGLGLGIAVIYLQGWMRKGIDSPERLERSGYPVLATILYRRKFDASRGGSNGERIIPLSDPSDVVVEGFRSLRTALHFSLAKAPNRAIMLTSPMPNAGKSFCARNFSAVAVGAGQRICLIDADMRRGNLRRHFSIPRGQVGLADYLAGTATLDEILVEGPTPGLWVIPAGKLPSDPLQLLMGPRLQTLVQQLDERFDLSIFDTPPGLPVTDPVIVAGAVGTTLVVVRQMNTTEAELSLLNTRLRKSGANIAGVVLNGFVPQQASSADGQSYDYFYSYSQHDQ